MLDVRQCMDTAGTAVAVCHANASHQPKQVQWGRNVVAQLFGGSVFNLMNLACERANGFVDLGRNGTYWQYAARMAGALPAGSALVVPEHFVAMTREHIAHLNDIGLAGGLTVIGVPGDHTHSLLELACQSPRPVRLALDQLGAATLTGLPYIGSSRATEFFTSMGVTCIPEPAMFALWLTSPVVRAQLASKEFGVVLDAAIPAPDGFVNVMVYVGDTPDHDRFITASRQLLCKERKTDPTPNMHCGNISFASGSPEEALLLRDLPTHCEVLRAGGVRGLVGIDLALDVVGRSTTFLEYNTRENGNCGASFTAIGAGAPCVCGVRLKCAVPKDLPLADYLNFLQREKIYYSPAAQYGVFVINPMTAARDDGDSAMQVGVRAPTQTLAEQWLNQAVWPM